MTVVYYTCNREYPLLEEAVRKTIRRNSGDLPIVSVSHKRIEFGNNISVGMIEQSPEHVFMQLRIGAEIAKSRFLAVCEADTLYPPSFFQFQPSRDDTYYYPRDGYVTWSGEAVYHGKRMRELTGIVAREHLLRILDVMQEESNAVDRAVLSGRDETLRIDKVIAGLGRVESVDLGAVVTLKTDRGMHYTSPHTNRSDRHVLPTWGSARGMWKRHKGATKWD